MRAFVLGRILRLAIHPQIRTLANANDMPVARNETSVRRLSFSFAALPRWGRPGSEQAGSASALKKNSETSSIVLMPAGRLLNRGYVWAILTRSQSHSLISAQVFDAVRDGTFKSFSARHDFPLNTPPIVPGSNITVFIVCSRETPTERATPAECICLRRRIINPAAASENLRGAR